jgi:hypothetical protein
VSYEVYLRDEDGKNVMVRPFMGGGTVLANPDTMEEVPQVEAWLNVTYNYSSLLNLAAKAALYDLTTAEVPLRVSAPNEFRTTTVLLGIREEGLRYLDGRTAMYVKDGLELMLAELDPRGVMRQHEDYWATTPGNVAAMLRTLVSWCAEAPAGEFVVH